MGLSTAWKCPHRQRFNKEIIIIIEKAQHVGLVIITLTQEEKFFLGELIEKMKITCGLTCCIDDKEFIIENKNTIVEFLKNGIFYKCDGGPLSNALNELESAEYVRFTWTPKGLDLLRANNIESDLLIQEV